MSRQFESTIAGDIYDLLFKNNYETMDFVQEFPSANVNHENATIELSDNKGNSYEIRVTHTHVTTPNGRT